MQNKPVTGSISQGWKDLNNSGPLFQKSLENVAAAYPSDWTPTEYALDYYATCMKVNLPPQQVDLGRSLRNLPSFLREYLLLDALKEAGHDVRLPSVEDNAHTHVDLILHLEGREVTVWSYLKTSKAVQMLKTKIQRRGIIRPGLNLLAPIDNKSETVSYYDWYVPSEDYVKRLIQAASAEPSHGVAALARSPTALLMSFLLFQQS